MMKSIPTFALLIFAILAHAQAGEITTGHEFEFGSRNLLHAKSPLTLVRSYREFVDIDPGDKEKKAVEEFRDEVIKRCAGGCYVAEVDGKWTKIGVPSFRVTFPDGWWFEITPDPFVVEIRGKPQTISELKANRDRMQYMIFESAAAVGLSPNCLSCRILRFASHFNFGVRSAFGSSGHDFLAFFTDFANFPALASGGFGKDFFSAPPISRLAKSQRKALAKLISEVNRGKSMTPAEVAQRILDDVYTATVHTGAYPGHDQAFSVKYVPKASDERDLPAELRPVEMVESVDEFILMAEVVNARVNYVKHRRQPIVYGQSERHAFSAQETVNQFYIYISEAGLDFERYRPLLMKRNQGIKPDDFLMGRIDWESRSYRESVFANLEYLETSPLVQQRLFAALNDAESGKGSNRGRLVISRLGAALNASSQERSYEAKDAIIGFLRHVEEIPRWQHTIAELLGPAPRSKPLPSRTHGLTCNALFR